MTTHNAPSPYHHPPADTMTTQPIALPLLAGNINENLGHLPGARSMTVHHLAPPPRPRHEPPWLEQPEAAPRPRAVTVSTGLWLMAAAVAAVSIALTLVELDQVKASILADVARQLPDELPATRDRVAAALLGIVIGGGAVILLLQLGFALGLRAGKRWARVALVLIGLVGAGHDLVALGAVPQPALVGLTGIAVVGGTVAMFLPVSNRWLRGGRR